MFEGRWRYLLRAAGRLSAVVLAVLVGGCAAVNPFVDRESVMDLRDRGRDEVRGAVGVEYGHGIGETREEARRAAAGELAEQLLTFVRSEFRERQTALQAEGEVAVETMTEARMESATDTMTNVALAGVETDVERQARDGWYVRVRLDSGRMDALRERAANQAPALAAFESVAALPESAAGGRLHAALRGLVDMDRTGVGDEAVYHPDTGRTTFRSFFEESVGDSVAAIRAVPLVDGGRARFVVVHRESLAPQRGVALRVGDAYLRSNAEGVTESVAVTDLGDEADVYILGYAEAVGDGAPGEAWRYPDRGLLHSTTLYPGEWVDRTPLLLVHTEPAEAVVDVAGVYRGSPARFRVEPGRSYDLIIEDGEDHQGYRERVEIPEGAPFVYRSVRLTDRRFGVLSLRAEGRHSRFFLDGPGGRQQVDGNSVDLRTDVGRYTVQVYRDGRDDYQIIRDEVTVAEGERVERDYVAPRYRRPYARGFRMGLAVGRIGGGLEDEYELPASGGGDSDYGAFRDAHDVSQPAVGLDLIGQYQRFFSAAAVGWTVQGEAGLRARTIDTDGGDLDLTAFHAAAGFGPWRPVGEGGIWLTANYALESARWRGDVRDEWGLPDSQVTNHYPYLELGFATGFFFAALRGGVDTVAPHLMIGFGIVDTERGYEHRRATHAVEGEHY